MNKFGRVSACLVLLSFSGCAIHTPFEVTRFWADYNTERQCNAQVEAFDHLPPHTARIKLMRWGYNVGPDYYSGTGTWGIGTGVWAERLLFWRRTERFDGPTDMPVNGSSPPTPTSPSDPGPEAMPALPPPAPPAETPEADGNRADPLQGNLSAARPPRRIATVGHQADARQPTSRAANAAWMFTATGRAR